MFIILKGNVAVSRKDALGHAQLILEEGAGAFLARRWRRIARVLRD
jgi:hypothetical protein